STASKNSFKPLSRSLLKYQLIASTSRIALLSGRGAATAVDLEITFSDLAFDIFISPCRSHSLRHTIGQRIIRRRHPISSPLDRIILKQIHQSLRRLQQLHQLATTDHTTRTH